MQATLGDSTTTWVNLRSGRVTGRGRIVPRLDFEIWARTPRERMEVHLHVLQVWLIAAGETLGDGFATGVVLGNTDSQVRLEVPVSMSALAYLDSAAVGERVDLTLQLSGFMRANDANDDGPKYASNPRPGELVYTPFGRARTTELTFQVPRSDWFSQVLTPIGTVDYVSTEIALPRGDHALRAAVKLMHEADRAFGNGDDPTVFARCRAAVEALPGAPKEIFAGLSDRHEAAVLDQLLKQAVAYFHRGRHVASDGPQRGDFPVDHHDAKFALNLAKLLIAHTARVLDAS